MKFKRIMSICLAIIMVVSVASIAVTSVSAATNPYSDAAIQLDKDFAYDGELGAIYSPEETTFKVWAPTATEVKVNLYSAGSKAEAEEAEEEDLIDSFDMTNNNGVWSYKYVGDAKNIYYTYTVKAKNILGENVKEKETIDPYANAAGVNGQRGMVVDLASTNPENWENDNHVLVKNQTDATVWEVHVKDFSYNENSGVSEENRGKYLAFTELGTTLNDKGDIATCVDYLKELGITHVQINPFYDFGSIDEAGEDTQFNWGYDPMNYNIPEGSYSSNPYDGNVRINETKQMIQALHNAGIGVIMDVVYNHTYITDTSFQAMVPDYYYRKAADGTFSAASGCGNDTASERAMFRKFMVDSVKHWVNEYHVDGFRFDLMGLHDAETMNIIRKELDDIDERIIIFGEGWSMDSTVNDPVTCTGEATVLANQQKATLIDNRVAFFNDTIRDGIKGSVFDLQAPGFVQGLKSEAKRVAHGIQANTIGREGWRSNDPEQCVTYASCHDNQTLYDRLIASVKGLNVDFRARYADIVEMNKLSSAITFSSQGIGFMMAGEEMSRSKDNDHNSYMSSATLNMIDWENLEEYGDVVSYYKGMLELRKTFSPWTEPTKENGSEYKMTEGINVFGNVISYVVENKATDEWQTVGVMFNASKEAQEVTLDTENQDWVVVANKNAAGVTSLGELKGNTLTVEPRSALIVVDKASFEATDVKTDNSRVFVKHVDAKSGKLLSEQSLLGKKGTTYVSVADSSLYLEYDVDEIKGDAKGTFGEKDIEVIYSYKPYTPSSLNDENSITGDVISIKDATKIQKYIADIDKLSEEEVKKADYTCDGTVNILDATMVQKYLAEYPIGLGTVTTKYLSVDGDGKEVNLKEPLIEQDRVGADYKTEAAELTMYELDESKLPTNAEGIVPYGDVEVKYYYTYDAVEITVHAKHNGDLTWAPTLWAWDDNGVNVFDAWPGYTMQGEADADGWFTDRFIIPGDAGYNLIVSNNGSPQTTDYEGLKATDTEIWIVIDDARATDKGDWITITTTKPE